LKASSLYNKKVALSSNNSQKGFSALGLFFMGLGLLILMSATGFFTHPKSPVTDQDTYEVSNHPTSDADGLQIINLEFRKSSLVAAPSVTTAPITITETPQPTITTTPTITPTPTTIVPVLSTTPDPTRPIFD
jgi:hypothetical protein